jgi:hypothetical protein
MSNDTIEFADRYMAVWNEADPERRRRAVPELWTEDGAYLLQPPQEIREVAARPGLGMTATLESRGHAELEARTGNVYEEFVAPGEYRFRRRDNVERVADAVKFNWEMVSRSGGDVAAVGLAFLLLAPDGRIRREYHFIEG